MTYFNPKEAPRIIGHRGASAYAPENTISSIYKASSLHATCVEVDVRLTACHELVLFHDDELHRTTNGQGVVELTPLATLQSLDAGSWFDRQYRGIQIPTLLDVMNCVVHCQMNINFELKPHLGNEKLLARYFATFFQEHWQEAYPWFLVSSFSRELLHALKQEEPRIPIGLVVDEWEDDALEWLNRHGGVSLNMNHHHTTQAIIERLRNENIITMAYTVNDPAQAQHLLSLGVSSIFSDYPDLLSGEIKR